MNTLAPENAGGATAMFMRFASVLQRKKAE